ncbi:hypothetical protein ACLOJK_000542 [Asimina triloba]
MTVRRFEEDEKGDGFSPDVRGSKVSSSSASHVRSGREDGFSSAFMAACRNQIRRVLAGEDWPSCQIWWQCAADRILQGSHMAAVCFAGSREDGFFFPPINGGSPALQKVSEQRDAACAFDARLVRNGFSPGVERRTNTVLCLVIQTVKSVDDDDNNGICSFRSCR